MNPDFDVAIVCPSGHEINSYSKTMPEFNRAFCEKCGGEGISACPRCSKPIRGSYLELTDEYVPPTFCGECGKPMPWTETRLRAAHDLIEELEELTPEDRKRLNESVTQLVRDSPETPVAVVRIKKIAMKVGKGSWTLLEKIFTDVASETAKKMLGLP